MSLLPSNAVAMSEEEKVAQFKTAFIYNIAKFVSWSETELAERTDFSLCLYRSNPLGTATEQLNNKTIKGLSVKTKVLSSLLQTDGCHILYISDSELLNYIREYNASDVGPVLTITDNSTLAPDGDVIEGVVMNLVRQGSSIGFEINLKEAKRKQLLMSSQLLKLAHIVGGDE